MPLFRLMILLAAAAGGTAAAVSIPDEKAHLAAEVEALRAVEATAHTASN